MARLLRRLPRWLKVLLLTMSVTIVGAGLFAVRTIVVFSGNLQQIIEDEFARRTGGTLDVGGISWHWGHVDFTDVQADAPVLPGEFRIERVRVHLAFRAAMRHQMISAVKRIEFVSPTITLDKSSIDRLRNMRGREKPASIGPLPNIALAIGDGAIRYRPPSKRAPVNLATHIAGWIQLGDHVGLNLSGNALSDSVNLALFGAFPLDGGTADLRLNATDIKLDRLRESLPAILHGNVDVVLTYADSLDAQVRLDGVEYVRGDSLRFGPVSTAVAVHGTQAQWEQTVLPLANLELTTAGSVRWGDNPYIDATATWSGSVDRLGHLVSPALADLSGDVRGTFEVSGSPEAPLVSFSLMSDSLSGHGVGAEQIAIRGHSEPFEGGDRPTKLFVDSFDAVVESIPITGAGAGTLQPLAMNVRLSPTRIPVERFAAARDAGLTGQMTASAGVRVTGGDIVADLRIRDADLTWKERAIPIHRLDVVRDSVGVVTVLGSGAHVRVEGIVSTRSDSASAITGNVVLDRYPFSPDSDASRVSGSLAFAVDSASVTANGAVDVASSDGTTTHADMTLHKGWGNQSTPLTIEANSPAVPFKTLRPDVQATLTFENGSWGFRGTAWRQRARFAGRAGGKSDFGVLITLKNAPIERLAQLVKMDDFITDGDVSGRIRIANDPTNGMTGAGEFDVEDMTFRDLDQLGTHVSVEIDPDTVAWRTADVVRNGRAIAFNSGAYYRNRHFVEVDTWSAPTGTLDDGLALGGVGIDASGQALWSVRVTDQQGDSIPPGLRIEVMATQGELLTVPFDTTNVLIDGNTDWLTIERGYLTKTGRYSADTRNGKIPVSAISSGGEFDIPVYVRSEPGNDVLNAITTLIDQDVVGHGEGEGYLRVAGPPSEVVIGEGWLEVRKGTLTWPGKIWPEWRDVQGRVAVLPGTRFLSVEQFSARVGSGRIEASNVQVESVGATPLTIDVIGLSLGVLELSTPNAIPLHIEGGMPDGESMDIKLRGNGDLKRFAIAGPWEHPVFIGEISFSDGYFTYPLQESDDDDDEEEADFISSVNWQVDLSVGHNVYYESRRSENLWRSFLRDPIQLIGSMAAEIEARLAEGGRFQLRGIYSDGSLNIVTNNIYSEQARLSVLDVDFEPDGPLVLDWDTRADPEPLIQGRGRATVQVDQDLSSLPTDNGDVNGNGFQYQDIYARLVSMDPVTGTVRQGGRLGELLVELDTEESRQGPLGERQQLAILRMLGYYAPGQGQDLYDPTESQQIDPRDIVTAGYRTILRRSEQQAWRSLFSPFRRQIRRFTRIDVVDVRPSVVLNVLDRDLIGNAHMNAEQAYLAYLHGTNWTIGEYIWGRFLVSYHGELERNSISHPTIGARHQITVEWALSMKTRLELSRDIDVPFGEPDTRIGVSHRFAFESY